MSKNRNICDDPTCRNYEQYCRLHLQGSMPEKKPIAPRGKKLDKLMKKDYVPQVKEMVEKGTRCSINSPVCIGEATGFHHPFGKASEELRLKNKVPCCDPCNGFIEKNDAWARQQGHKKSKFSIPAKNHQNNVRR